MPSALGKVWHQHRAKFEAELSPHLYNWIIPLGDNWLWCWSTAERIEKQHGIDHQDVLRMLHRDYYKPGIAAYEASKEPNDA